MADLAEAITAIRSGFHSVLITMAEAAARAAGHEGLDEMERMTAGVVFAIRGTLPARAEAEPDA